MISAQNHLRLLNGSKEKIKDKRQKIKDRKTKGQGEGNVKIDSAFKGDKGDVKVRTQGVG